MYSYVGNNPINMVDPTGHFFNIIAGAIAGAIGGIITYASYHNGLSWDDLQKGQFWATVGVGAGVGALAGATFGASLPATIGIMAAAGAGEDILDQGINKGFDKIDYAQAAVSGGLGGVAGGIIHGVSGAVAKPIVEAATQPKPILKQGEVILGKYVKGSAESYEAVAQSRNATYFNLNNYNQLLQRYGKLEMKKINMDFIRQQWNANKTFILSHNPYTATGAFKNEVQQLYKLGAKGFVRNGSTWEVIR